MEDYLNFYVKEIADNMRQNPRRNLAINIYFYEIEMETWKSCIWKARLEHIHADTFWQEHLPRNWKSSLSLTSAVPSQSTFYFSVTNFLRTVINKIYILIIPVCFTIGILKFSIMSQTRPDLLPVREQCPNTEFFLVRIQENKDQKKLPIWTLFT